MVPKVQYRLQSILLVKKCGDGENVSYNSDNGSEAGDDATDPEPPTTFVKHWLQLRFPAGRNHCH